MKYKKRRHDEKVAAVRMVVEGGMTVTEAARRTDNSPATITAWLRDDDINPDKEYARLRRERIKPKPIDPFPQGVSAVARTNPEELVAENRNLRRKVAYLEDKVAYLESLFNSVSKKPWEIPKKKDSRQSENLSETEGETSEDCAQ